MAHRGSIADSVASVGFHFSLPYLNAPFLITKTPTISLHKKSVKPLPTLFEVEGVPSKL